MVQICVINSMEFLFFRAVWMNIPLNIFSTTLTVLTGLVIYAFYSSCDPLTTKEINTDDEVQLSHDYF